ncbi:mycofactocin biosynthesis glycosyltransferase MftF [Pseudonocardia sp. CA-107938]|uniref:mycofactocin biosynthesis glycosyltransferase MftF n=1 Tax=Pseudonocardia sp. CA-107938 TaxID=3240021 RepID=UPI003D8A110C
MRELPDGMRVRLDRSVRVLDGGRALLGGAPPRLMHLSPTAQAVLGHHRAVTITDGPSQELARRLLDAGAAHPEYEPPSAVPGASAVTVVVPVKDRAGGLARLLAALPAGLGEVLVVDDGSADPGAVAAVAAEHAARVLRHERSRGPAAARNTGLAAATTPLVAFLDSDVVPEPGWLGPLLEAFADPEVALAAPRIVALEPITGRLGRYEAVRSSLDLGPDPALIVPRTRVAYVPSAALLVRVTAVGAGFAESMHVAEDVDLVLRLHAEGWRLRYVPSARVAHDHRTTVAAWWRRKAFYGTGAAPLALRHPGSVPPMVLSPWAAGVGAAVLVARPWAAAAAVVASVVAGERLARRLDRLEHPRAVAARLVALGAVGAAAQTADAVTRHHWPLAAVAALCSRRARRRVVAIALASATIDWARHRRRDPRVRPDLPSYVGARLLDDLGYGTGLWWGAMRNRTLAPLLPVMVSTGGNRPSGLLRKGVRAGSAQPEPAVSRRL